MRRLPPLPLPAFRRRLRGTAKTRRARLDVRVDQDTARERAAARGVGVDRSLEEPARQDTGGAGRAFVEAVADFMRQYGKVFAKEAGERRR